MCRTSSPAAGVGNVTVFGAGQYAMRDLARSGPAAGARADAEDVIDVIQQQSQEVTAGQVGTPPAPKGQDFQYTFNVNGRLNDAAEFENIIVKVESRRTAADHPRARRRPRRARRADLQPVVHSGRPPAAGIAHLPPARSQRDRPLRRGRRPRWTSSPRASRRASPTPSPSTRRKFVQAAIPEVYRTLIEAGVLVLIVILVFLQDWRAMLVPATTVPVTIIGAFAAMAALGFTVNLSTLFAIVLAIGIVVDDAIVIVEGVARYIEQGLPGAAGGREGDGRTVRAGHRHHAGADVRLHPGRVPAGADGQLYRQFALVIAATALISAINAVTLKPTQCALWLRPPVPAGAAQRLLPRLQPRLRRRGARLCAAYRRHGPPRRPDGRRWRSRSSASRSAG